MVLDFLLKIHPTILVIGVGILVSVIMVLVYKWMTDQNLMKQLKEEIKELQNEMKTLRDNPTKMGEVNKKAMETNMKYMMHSMKPTLVTFIPIILIFGWLNSNIAYLPLVVGEEFSVELEFYDSISGEITATPPEGITLVNGEKYIIKDNKVRLVFVGETPGEYMLEYTLMNDAGEVQKSWKNNIIITASKEERAYEKPEVAVKDKILKMILVGNEKFKPFGDFMIFGWKPGWLALYIVISLVCSIGLRKALKVY